mmetsp:Transcript_77792/g.223393  ORF Transcript_77792/g.223393 Transcript_77792/m.223393 type:complete len:345 (+) Transcript_77792:501-1535(+)
MSGLGEATCLGLSQKFCNPKQCLVMWSSGTGAAGPGGYILNLFVFVHLNKGQKVVLGELIAAAYALLYFNGLQKSDQEPVRGWEPVSLPQDGSVQQHPKSNITTVESVASPLPMLAGDSGDDTVRFIDGAGEAGSGEGLVVGDGDNAGGNQFVESMSSSQRCRFVCSLWPYLIPLFTVYWSEYVMQAGAWTSFAFDPSQLNHKVKRDEAYEYFNFCYQWGVFISRSSGMLVSVNRLGLWAMPAIQTALLIMFTVDSVAQFWNGYTLLLPAFIVGLLGGGVYVNAFTLINKEVDPDLREMALSSACVADSTGILLADIMSLYWQWCLFAANGIADQADGACPFGH